MARAVPTLALLLDRLTVEGELYERLGAGKVRCLACGHRCVIFPGRRGICRVRFNDNGVLRVPWGYVAALQCDPIEKKPFYHVRPGARALTFGMLGCDYRCPNCQNWLTSQALRDPVAGTEPMEISPQEIVRLAVGEGAAYVVSSYNEPLITTEWALAIFKEAKQAGLRTGYVSNGNGTAEVLAALRPWTDCYKIDLKSFNDRNYRYLGGVLERVLDTIKRVYALGFWTEIVTLVIPGFNDTGDELRAIAEFIASVSPLIPWHVTAFHKDYRMTEPDDTPAETLLRAAGIGEAAGLKYVYAGNLPGRVGRYEHTFCHHCGALLVARRGYLILRDRLSPHRGRCPDCGTAIPGIWS
ncbi:MAG: AmmeMemoRadiSam system radical SAM enzyme [Armatimonadota bacterium]|nr:AmmeMemoRadiSam system radical SAM enzyme [Armatimonadota bacterium]MDR7450728.1 AmmeMemoRadiSam system radical SAM enzyme [Armatimonadota bacterium]MDR7466084.1 AmmeMemoRadiSam system radical SAM enzyme [Armatimonadota bacterium]MDR7493879.1 AmmeMemoRadiSam system radical SAM enzyme [Armatimonadota bacterium]MDR7498960.1 AmmeMemoRadiSam system radical SAM enzyme [Armatimonadota bacterium]